MGILTGDERGTTLAAPVLAGLGAVLAAVAAAAYVGRRVVLGRRERVASHAPPTGTARPGDEHVQRLCRPAPDSRKLHALTIQATDEVGHRTDIAAEFGPLSRAQRAVVSAIAAQRAGDDRWRDGKLDESAARLVGAIDGTLPHDGTVWTVTISGSWEGDRMRCTYHRWTCGPDGHWPVEPAASWTRSAPDQGTLDIGTLEGCGRRHASLLVTEVRPLLAGFVIQVAAD